MDKVVELFSVILLSAPAIGGWRTGQVNGRGPPYLQVQITP